MAQVGKGGQLGEVGRAGKRRQRRQRRQRRRIGPIGPIAPIGLCVLDQLRRVTDCGSRGHEWPRRATGCRLRYGLARRCPNWPIGDLPTTPALPTLAIWYWPNCANQELGQLAIYASFAFFASFASFAYLGHLVLARPRNSRLGPSGPTRLLCLLRFLCLLWLSGIGPIFHMKN